LPGLHNAPLKIQRECADYIYPSEEMSKFEVKYDNLSVEQMAAPFIVFFIMSILCIVGFIAEIVFHKLQSIRNNHSVVAGKLYRVEFILQLDATAARAVLHERLIKFLRDFDACYDVNRTNL
jgi:hypothetical protein